MKNGTRFSAQFYGNRQGPLVKWAGSANAEAGGFLIPPSFCFAKIHLPLQGRLFLLHNLTATKPCLAPWGEVDFAVGKRRRGVLKPLSPHPSRIRSTASPRGEAFCLPLTREVSPQVTEGENTITRAVEDAASNPIAARHKKTDRCGCNGRLFVYCLANSLGSHILMARSTSSTVLAISASFFSSISVNSFSFI